MKLTKVFIAFFAMLALPACMFAQANVTENQTTYVYVDARSGSDANPGTQASPFRTISKAATKATANNVKGIGTKVLINPGTYREVLGVYHTYNQTSAPITFQATQTGTAIIAASDVFTGWSQGTSNPAIYTHAWSYNFGSCPIPSGWPTGFAPVVQRTEMIFVNGMPLTQVMSLATLQSGTFYVDESANLISIWPSSSTTMATALVEAAVRPQTLVVSGRTNMVFRGLVFEHAANCINHHGANIGSSSNILVDSVQAKWNNWGGLGVSFSNLITVKNSIASHNGGVGFMAYRTKNALYQFNESDYNNWRGAMGAFYNWGMGGIKLFQTHSVTVDQMYVYRNQAQGLWFDTDNKNITITNARLAENSEANLQLEANEGPISLANSALCSGGTGALVINTAKLTASGNTFYNNGGTAKWQGQIYVAGKSGGRQETDWETGQGYLIYTESTSLHNNTFENAGTGQFVFATYLGGNDWSHFTGSLTSNSNRWFDGGSTQKFLTPNGKAVDLRGWQGLTGEDMASSWASNTQPALCAVPAPAFPDFSVNLNDHTFAMAAGGVAIPLQVNSFAYGQVLLSVGALPSGVYAAYSQAAVTRGTPVLTLTASASAVNQTIPVTIIATGGSRVHTVTVNVHVVPGTGTGTSPRLSVSAASLSFGSVTVNSASTQAVTLTSTGTAPVTVNSASITGGGYTIVGGSFPVVLSPTQAATLQVQFKPTTAGAASGQLTVNSTSSTSSVVVVPLSGNGVVQTPQLSVSPTAVSFGSVTIGSPATQNVTLTSTGTGPVTINAATITGAGFAVAGVSFPMTLNPSQSVALQVQFNPTTAAAATGQLTISSNSSVNPVAAVALSGTGAAAPNPQLTISQASVSFGSVTVGSPTTQSVTLTSTGTSAITVNSVGISGAGFTLNGGSSPMTLNPSQSVTLQIQFNPISVGAATGQLTINSNSSSGSTAVVALSGTGMAAPTPQLSVSAASLDFGSVVVNSASAQAITLTSTGASPVTINAATIAGSGFLVAGASLPLTLDPNQTTTLWVLFTPTTAGSATGQLTISSNSSSGSIATVALSGMGTVSIP